MWNKRRTNFGIPQHLLRIPKSQARLIACAIPTLAFFSSLYLCNNFALCLSNSDPDEIISPTINKDNTALNLGSRASFIFDIIVYLGLTMRK